VTCLQERALLLCQCQCVPAPPFAPLYVMQAPIYTYIGQLD
jgi:hypothetical protein